MPNDQLSDHLWIGGFMDPMDMVGFEAFLYLLIMWTFWSYYGIVSLLLGSSMLLEPLIVNKVINTLTVMKILMKS